MKETAKLLLVAFFFVPAAAAAGAPSPADFSECAEVQAPIKADSLYQVHLSGEIIQKAAPGLYDLRLFDGAGKETPFTIIENAPPYEDRPESFPLEITGYKPGPPTAVITMKLPEQHQAISLLELDIAERDFKKHAVLSASRDGKTWQSLAEDSVYDFSSQVDLRKTRIEFGKTDARFYRIELTDYQPQPAGGPSVRLRYEGLEFNVNGAQKKGLRINGVQGRTLIPAEKKPLYDRMSFPAAPAADKDGNTVLLLGAALPVDRLALEVANHFYYRTVDLYGSTTGKDDSYRLLATRPIYRIPLSPEQQEEKNEIEVSAPKYAYYKIVVLNKNNPSLDIRSVTASWVRQNLYFIALKNDERYSLCYGNRHMARPDYDIVNFVNRNSLSRLSFEQASLALPVKGAGPSPTLQERLAATEQLILKFVVVLLVIGMGGWLYTLLKKKPEQK